ncbi:MAG TPA: acetyl-CoA carboxylase carboxyltransferase subunit alpha/beta [Ktedonobacteraceae bacterium]|nr:acetyl-CoA carboxylase carboxyltransferase subunit alpha/beta [Ktedonobacteraceae bacterium]
MSITTTFAQRKLKLPGAHDLVFVAGLRRLYSSLFPMVSETKTSVAASPLSQPQKCPECKTELGEANEVYSRIAVCDACGYHFVWSAFRRVEHLADPGSFKAIGRPIEPVDFLGFVDEPSYATKLIVAQKQTGLSDAILSGRCRIGGTETVLSVLDFHFMGGSMGSVVGEQITYAFEYAMKHRLPVVTVVNSGGARMQEGIISLMQMPKTVAAFQRFHASGLLYLSVLASPSTGGVFASFASLGDVILAEPKALVGFAGPRVAEQVIGQKLPAGSHRAEMLLTSGQIDAITARQDLPSVLATLLKATEIHTKHHRVHSIHTKNLPLVSTSAPRNTTWESVKLARHPDRPTARDYIRYLSPHFLELQGDRCYGDDPTVVAGLGDIYGHTVIFVGQERQHRTHDSADIKTQTRPQPEGYRKAIRMMELAAQLHCPLVTLVDTSGADPGDESERHGIAWSLAHCLSTMSGLPVPIVTAIIGEGASGGAVALAMADTILMLQNAIYEVIAPEGAATILYRDAEKARQVAEQLQLTALDCLRLGVVDTIIPEPLAGAHTDPAMVMQALQQHLLHAIAELERVPVKQLLARRYRKFRRHGRFQRKQVERAMKSYRSYARASAIGVGQEHGGRTPGGRPQGSPLRVTMAIISRLSTVVIHRREHKQSLASS